MKRSILVAAALTAALSTAAFAQQAQQTPAPATPQASSTASGEKMMLKGSWRASKLIGLDVYNDANEKLGDINELILDKNGKINAVVIGVGGFLGMGEHDVAVTMDKLKFMETPVRTSSTAPATTTERRETTGAAPAATNTTTTRTDSARADVNDWVPNHAVMSATKDQLKSMPQFKYSDYN